MDSNMTKSSKKKETAVFIAIIIAITLFTYHNVLIGDEYFLSSGNAMDMYDQFYPRLLSVARGLEEGRKGAHIDFTYGVGLEVNYDEFALNNIPAYFGKQNVAYLLGIFQVVKVIISALFFYFYVKLLGAGRFVSYMAGISYAYCGHMIIRQYWLSYSNEIFLFAIWLWAFEQFLRKNRKWLPLITLLFMLNMSSLYYIILYAGIFILYALIRLETIYQKKDYLKHFLIFLVGVIIISLVAIGPTAVVDQFFDIFSSDRFQRGISAESESTSRTLLTSPINLAAMFFRTIGIDINGVKKNYFGQYGILGDATFYIGLLPLIFLPFSLQNIQGKEKKWFILISLCGLLYILVDDFRNLCNGFSSENYKISSFWIIFFSLYCFTKGAGNYFQKPTIRITLYLLCANCLLIIISKILLHKYFADIQVNYMLKAIGFMYIYQFLLLAYHCCSHQKLIKIMMFSTFLLEIVSTSYSRIENMNLDPKEWVDGRNGYNDYTLESLAEISRHEPLKEYRIDKQFFSYRYNDPMAQDYYGTSFYFGGTGIGNAIIQFYDSLKLPTAEPGYNYAFGTSISDEINTILGIRYILSKNDSIKNYGYEIVDEQNGIYTYKNSFSLPFVFVYNQFIPQDEFEKLSLDEKKCALLQACIVNQEDIEKSFGRQAQLDDIVNWKETFDYAKYTIPYSQNPDDNSIYLPDYEANSTVVIKVKFNLKSPEYRGMLKYFLSDNEEINYKVRIDNSEIFTFEINASDVKRILFTDENGNNIDYQFIGCYILPQNIYYNEYQKCIESLQKSSMHIDSISYNKLHGTICLDEPGILFFSSPFSKWQIFIDGEETASYIANIGFTGCNISKGEHEISIVYSSYGNSLDTYIRYGLFILFIGYFIYCLSKRKGKYRWQHHCVNFSEETKF